MACKVQKRISLRRKLHILRVLANSNHAKRTSIPKSTVLHLHKLKFALETIKREYENLLATRREYISSLLNHVKENKHARVSCENGFSLEAIVVAEDQTLDVRDVTEALLKAIGKQSGEKDSQEVDDKCSNL
ncbi:hypothetical protein SESBI_10552 [Sesbania bispinosa]|nr:hypothetical protein SESBI_10552 [Sesbania bispinosa]